MLIFSDMKYACFFQRSYNLCSIQSLLFALFLATSSLRPVFPGTRGRPCSLRIANTECRILTELESKTTLLCCRDHQMLPIFKQCQGIVILRDCPLIVHCLGCCTVSFLFQTYCCRCWEQHQSLFSPCCWGISFELVFSDVGGRFTNKLKHTAPSMEPPNLSIPKNAKEKNINPWLSKDRCGTAMNFFKWFARILTETWHFCQGPRHPKSHQAPHRHQFGGGQCAGWVDFRAEVLGLQDFQHRIWCPIHQIEDTRVQTARFL